jgi:nitrite reductase (NO-forming)
VKVRIETVELDGKLDDGTTFTYWTFDKRVPGPMLRVKKGDTIELTLANAKGSKMVHSIDLHATTGPGGGAAFLQVPPGQEKTVSFKALNPGLYVYHCATPSVPEHISAGMYGMILVEPENGLPKVDREFYVMQGDIYTKHKTGTKGHQPFDHDKLAAELPDYYVFNGAVGALTREHKMQAAVGETVRIYFGVGGPNKISSFHVIGEIFDRVYTEASTSAPRENVQTTSVPPGGAAIVELKVDYPGKYALVDHALSRVGKGLVGILEVTGKADSSIYRDHGESPKNPSMDH